MLQRFLFVGRTNQAHSRCKASRNAGAGSVDPLADSFPGPLGVKNPDPRTHVSRTEDAPVLRKNSVKSMPPLAGDCIRDEVPLESRLRQFAHWLVIDVVVLFVAAGIIWSGIPSPKVECGRPRL